MFRNTPMTGDGAPPSMVGYGDIHESFLEVAQGRTLFNVGSVGNPLDEPEPSYVLLEGALGEQAPGRFSMQIVRVPYDVESEISTAARWGPCNSRPSSRLGWLVVSGIWGCPLTRDGVGFRDN